ncbi:MAG TPA: AraC family transcriptional regulator [Thermoanaerobaculia bacterium]|nr:AraC family transcriptional regulator [Thermoanaerobaculia bacterium]
MPFYGRPVASAAWEHVQLSETRFARGAFLPLHRHDDAYLTFVLSGAYRERAGSETRDCQPRTVVVHPAGDTHEDSFAQQARCLNAVLAPAFLRRLGAASAVLDRGGVAGGPQMSLIGGRIAAELRAADASSPIIIEGLLLELFGLLSRCESPARTPAWLTEAHAILGRTFAEKPSLAAIADEVGVHPVHLARAFRQTYGFSVGEHVRALRVAHARERIAAGVPLTTVAAEAGFADQSHFTRTFKRLLGVSPAEYRRRLR